VQLKPWSDEIHALTTKIEYWDTRRFKIRTKWTGTPPLFKVSHHRVYPEPFQIAAQGEKVQLCSANG
jgi:hypothetical protein